MHDLLLPVVVDVYVDGVTFFQNACTYLCWRGLRNIKRLSSGLLPVGCKSWPCDDVPDVQTAKRIRGPPLSPFVAKVLEDHPGLTTAEAKIVADTLLRCADHAASQIPASAV